MHQVPCLHPLPLLRRPPPSLTPPPSLPHTTQHNTTNKQYPPCAAVVSLEVGELLEPWVAVGWEHLPVSKNVDSLHR